MTGISLLIMLDEIGNKFERIIDRKFESDITETQNDNFGLRCFCTIFFNCDFHKEGGSYASPNSLSDLLFQLYKVLSLIC